MVKSFSQDNTDSLAKLLKQNSTKKNKEPVKILGRIKPKSYKKELTVEEKLQRVKNEKSTNKANSGQGKGMLLCQAFRIIYFCSVSFVFAFGVLQFGNSMIIALQNFVYNFATIIKG